jgi:hypothetical protein
MLIEILCKSKIIVRTISNLLLEKHGFIWTFANGCLLTSRKE